MHLCIGQEAVAVGVSAALEPADMVFSNHRAHGHYLAKGGDLIAMIAEIYGLSGGCCGGRGGSMHLIDLDARFMGATPIVGGTVPLAVGAAWAAALRRTGQVVAVYFGDGCFEEGVLHESMNFATLHRLPVIFVCENNQFSVYTKLEARQPKRPIHGIARAHGLKAESGDGNDVEAVQQLAAAACARARAGEGPQFLEFSVYRWREHCGPNFDDDLGYRDAREVAAGQACCPLKAYQQVLQARGWANSVDFAGWEADVASEIAAEFGAALASAPPLALSATEKVYAC